MFSPDIPTSYSAVLLDIEGTTTPISFVEDVLFPYAANNVEEFLIGSFATKRNAANESAVIADLVQLSNEQAREDTRVDMINSIALQTASSNGDLEAVGTMMKALARNFLWWIAQDKKFTALKTLQGDIWRHGYVTGQLKGRLFPDVPEALRRWHDNGIPVHIFSSDFIQVQKLLFAYSTAGDLSWYVSSYFDTTTGAKTDGRSYEKIAIALRQSPGEILFITDVDKEAFAARAAGLQVVISVRDGNAPISTESASVFPQLRSFVDIFGGAF